MVISSKLFYEHGQGYTKPTMPIEPTQERLYSITEAAEKLGMSRQRVHQLIQEGRLLATQHGKMWLISEDEIAALQSRIKPTGRPRKG